MTDKVGHLIGDALIVLSIAFTVYLIVIMISRVKSVVLKDEYLTGFKYEMVACALLDHLLYGFAFWVSVPF